MANTRVKICGITRAEDAVRAGEFGVDAIGLNFVAGPRRIPASRAMEINNAVPRAIDIIALKFLDKEVMASYKKELIETTGFFMMEFRRFRAVQLYGFTEDWIQQPQRPFMQRWVTDNPSCIWLPVPVRDRGSLSQLSNQHSVLGLLCSLNVRPGAILLDTASPEKLGGSGQSFDWNWIAEARAAGELEGLPPIILAGGLTPENVAEAIRIVQPYAVDVSSGVEVTGKPGVKDAIKMRDFIQAAKGA